MTPNVSFTVSILLSLHMFVSHRESINSPTLYVRAMLALKPPQQKIIRSGNARAFAHQVPTSSQSQKVGMADTMIINHNKATPPQVSLKYLLFTTSPKHIAVCSQHA